MTGLGACVTIGATVFLAVAAYSEIQPTVEDGGSVVIPLESDYSDDINHGSSLRRSLVTLNDTACPIEIIGTAQDWRSWEVRTRSPVSAFEVRFLLFDVFGQSLGSTSYMDITDLELGVETSVFLMGKVDPSLLTVISFVARVRTSEGQVWEYDKDAIVKSIVDLQLGPTTVDLSGNGEEEGE